MKKLFERNKYLFVFIINIGLLVLILLGATIWFTVTKGSFSNGWLYTTQFLMSDIGQVYHFTLTENPYITGYKSMYLPFNFILLMPFALICKGEKAFYTLAKIDMNGDFYQDILDYNVGILSTWQFWVATILFFVVFATINGMIIYRMRNWQSKSCFILGYISVVFSGAFAFGIFRGTTVYQALTFLLLFLWLYKSPKKWLREIALLCLAIVGVMKLYPLLFGVLLLKDKRFLDSCKVALYFFVLAFVPFLMYENPFGTIQAYLSNLTNFSQGLANKLGDKTNLSVFSLFGSIFDLFKLSELKFSSIVCWLLTIAVFVISIIASLREKNIALTLFVICAGMTLIPTVSYFYVLLFMIIPLIALFDNWNDLDKIEKRMFIAYYIVWSLLPLVALRIYFLQSLFTLVILVYIFVRQFKNTKCRQLMAERK